MNDNTAEPRVWCVYRQDDHGNVFDVKHELRRSDADAMVEALTASGHKQTYWVEGHARCLAQRSL